MVGGDLDDPHRQEVLDLEHVALEGPPAHHRRASGLRGGGPHVLEVREQPPPVAVGGRHRPRRPHRSETSPPATRPLAPVRHGVAIRRSSYRGGEAGEHGLGVEAEMDDQVGNPPARTPGGWRQVRVVEAGDDLADQVELVAEDRPGLLGGERGRHPAADPVARNGGIVDLPGVAHTERLARLAGERQTGTVDATPATPDEHLHVEVPPGGC